MYAYCVFNDYQDGETIVEYKPLEDSVDPSNMLCAGKVWHFLLECLIHQNANQLFSNFVRYIAM